MNRFLKVIVLMLAIIMLFSVPVCAENVDTKASSYFMTSNAYLNETSATKFQVCFSVSAFDIMDEIGASSIKVQRSSDGNTWTTVKTYTKSSYPYLIGYDTSAHGAFVTYTGTTGYYYRAQITLYAKQGNGIGELTRYTSKIKL